MKLKRYPQITFFLAMSLIQFCIAVGNPNRETFRPPEQKRIRDWQTVIQKNQSITDLTIFHTGAVEVPLSGMINLDDPKLKGEKDKRIFVDVYSFWFCHKTHGCFLIDSGLDSSFQKGGNLKGLISGYYISNTKQNPGQDITSHLNRKGKPIQAVFFTHLHGDHTAGVSGLPKEIEFYAGAKEEYINYWPIYYGGHLDTVKHLKEIDCSQGMEMPILGIVIDVFGDGSLFAIPTPGHSNSHLSYLVVSDAGTYLFTGDASHTYRGFQLGVESGWQDNRKQAKESLEKLRNFAAANPQIKVIPGHELPPGVSVGEQKFSAKR
ncbi:MBL fold metallo-hydrolase [Leptospira ilyithenensis]|uniref:MBL fold metallo-hydrolase n=1 Tax=Leptospira ilyithenensis TaxID=2484901 RepID=A0A4R9LX96_9LEPT|nr:MBL fold metallo-hydrolase [Leptospira ilyithenensis]TGN16806.1 MBL fold metallo-hydrolase [Leptospira ilyithenensis]